MTSTMSFDLDPQRTKNLKALDEIESRDSNFVPQLVKLSTPRIVEPYFRHIPHPAQQWFLSLGFAKEVMYGGAAGGGKSDALLMAALQYVDVPGYSALILRRTWPDLNSPGAILDRARDWLAPTDAHIRDGGRIIEFPSGATIQFGYLQHDKDKYKFQSAEYQMIGWDELTQFEESTYSYMHSRTRRPSVSCLNCGTSIRLYRNGHDGEYWQHTSRQMRKECPKEWADPMVREQYKPSPSGLTIFDVPIRIRSATNPGGPGHSWVKSYFIDDNTRKPGAVYVPARLSDNPSLDQEEYVKSLEHMLPVDRERLLNGDWDIENEGDFFTRHEFIPVDQAPVKVQQRVRCWDLAATDEKSSDWTAGALVSLDMDGMWYIEDMVRFKGRPLEVEQRIRQTAMQDGIGVPIHMEQEPGSSGVAVIDNYKRKVLTGFQFSGHRSTGPKTERAKVVSSAVQGKNVSIVMGQWNAQFLDEAALFPGGAWDDQIDAVSLAFNQISFGKRTRLIV